MDGFIRKMTSKKGRWITLIIWIIFTAVLSMTLPMVNSQEDNSAGQLPNDAMSEQAQKIADEQFPNEAGVPLLITWQRDGGLTQDDYQTIKEFYQKLDEDPLKGQSLIPPFAKLPPQALMKSASDDGEAIITPVFFEKNAGIEKLTDAVDEAKSRITDLTDKSVIKSDIDSDGLHARMTGPVGIQVDATALFSQADVKLLLGTVLLVLILLIVLYRSPILAIVPLIGVGFAYGVISPILGGLAKSGIITVDSQAVSIMTVLLFGAGTDYCLFLVSKYRENLLEEENKYIALKEALKHSGGAIMMSALTVVLGLLTLLLAHYGSYDRFAVPFSLAVLIMGIAALTLLPAILALLGRASFWPFIPRTEGMARAKAEKKGKKVKRHQAHGKISRALGKFVTRRPWAVIIVTVIVLGGLASFAPKINYTYDLIESFPDDMPSREGFDIIADHFAPGQLAPVQVIVDSQGKDINVKKKLENLDFVKSVADPKKGEDNKDLLSYSVTLDQNPYTPDSIALIPDIKDTVKSALKSSGINPSDNYWIGGETSNLYDTKQVTNRDAKVIVPTVIIIIALLLLIYLRSVIAMIYLMLTVLLSYFSALGTGWLVLHFGMGVPAIQGLIPLYSFVFLVALGEDYNIFMISSIWKNRETQPLKTAIANGVTETSSVITSAGLILAGTFAVLATLPIQVLVQFGTVTAIGVLLDTFVVRPLLVPAITTVLGRFAFWPGKLWKKKDTGRERMENE